MSNVVPITPGVTTIGDAAQPNNPPVDRIGGGGDDGGMDARIAALEQQFIKTNERLARIETELQHKASKADVSEAKNSIITWVVSAILLSQLLPAIMKKFGL